MTFGTSENCHTMFRRVSEVHEDVVDPYEEPDALSSASSKLATERQQIKRAEKNQSVDRIQDFRRVRLICKIRNSWHDRSDNVDRQEKPELPSSAPIFSARCRDAQAMYDHEAADHIIDSSTYLYIYRL